MYITKYTPFSYDIKLDPWSTIVCNIKIKGTKKPIKLNINAQIYYNNQEFKNRIDVITSDNHTIYTSPINNSQIIKINIPGFNFQHRLKSFVYISLSPDEDINTKILIEDLLIEELSAYENRILTAKERLKIKKEKLRRGNIDVTCEGLILGDSGFAKAMRNIILELDKYCNIRAIPLDGDNINFLNSEKGKKLNRLMANNIDPSFWICMNNPMGVSKQECYSIGFVMFETEVFPYRYVKHLSQLDEIWTPSNFCKNSMIKSGLNKEKVFLMPLGVDTDLYDPEKVKPISCSQLGIPLIENKYKFLCVCGFSARKGIHILVRAFAEEFANNKDVILYIKGGWYIKQKAQNEINDIIKDIKNPPYIHLDFNIYPENILARIYKMADAFVLPTLGEGWLLPATEAMSMELPTICTRYGGQLEFMNDDNSYLIDTDGTAPEPRCDWICEEYVGGKFAVPNKDHLRKLMRFVYENRYDAKEKGKIAREYVVDNFSWEISCEKMYERLKNIVKDICEKDESDNKIDNKNINNDNNDNNNKRIDLDYDKNN